MVDLPPEERKMGIRKVSLAFWENSQQEEEWTFTDWKCISLSTFEHIANEVVGFGLEIELVEESIDDYYRWRIVSIKE